MNEVNWNAFQWDGHNELWEEVLAQLDAFHVAEVEVLTSPDLSAEQRHYVAGRAAAISEYRDHLKSLRNAAQTNRK